MTLSDHIIALLGRGPMTQDEIEGRLAAEPPDTEAALHQLESAKRITRRIITVWSIGGPGKS